ncbi:MAG: hypothetical protein VZT48_04575 [Bulleidia sp.]|nr:hypothetical protein [Bulleidia sp.]
MSTENIEANASYQKGMHRFGRFSMIFMMILMLAVPFEIAAYYGEGITFNSGYWAAFAALCVQYVPSDIIEVITYAPLLGTGGTYIAFITGNLINLKIPCVMNAEDNAGTKPGTMENELIGTIAVAASAITTILTLAVGVLLITPLTPVLQNPVLTPAFKTVVSALFGALGCTYFSKYPKVTVLPVILAVVIFALVPSLTSMVSIMVVVMAAVSMGWAVLLYRKGRIE